MRRSGSWRRVLLMSRLLAIIDKYRDAHGQPSDASIARAIGLSPQAISSWRRRGIRQLPNKEALVALAALIRVDYREVFEAAAADAGYLSEGGDGDDGSAAPIAEAN